MNAKEALENFKKSAAGEVTEEVPEFLPSLRLTTDDKPGFFLDGVYLGQRKVKKVQGEGDSVILRFRVNSTNAPAEKYAGKGKDKLPVLVKNGDEVEVMAPAQLERIFAKTKENTSTFLEYNGKKKTARGTKAHNFTVYLDKQAVDQEV